MEYTFKTANEAWTVIFDDLSKNEENFKHEISGFYQSKPRGRLCNETIDLSIKILEPQNCLIWTKLRKLPPTYLAKECLWYLSGSRNPDDSPAPGVWNKLKNKENDKESGLINSNYGHWIFNKKDNKNKNASIYEETINMFKKDPDTRQAIWQIPIMPYRQYDDTPCTSSAHFILRDNKLYLTMYQRSCDAWFGAANDITQFIIWQMMLAKDLNVELGTYRHIFGSYHVYEENFINDLEEFHKILDEEYLIGKENIGYFKFYDDRNYREILDEIMNDFNILSKNKKQDIIDKRLIKNKELNYMIKNMEVKNFKH